MDVQRMDLQRMALPRQDGGGRSDRYAPGHHVREFEELRLPTRAKAAVHNVDVEADHVKGHPVVHGQQVCDREAAQPAARNVKTNKSDFSRKYQNSKNDFSRNYQKQQGRFQ